VVVKIVFSEFLMLFNFVNSSHATSTHTKSHACSNAKNHHNCIGHKCVGNILCLFSCHVSKFKSHWTFTLIVMLLKAMCFTSILIIRSIIIVEEPSTSMSVCLVSSSVVFKVNCLISYIYYKVSGY